MFRSRGENLRSTYILLFLNVAFFLLQYQDSQKFSRLFGFDRDAVAAGQVWRLFTYQFAAPASGNHTITSRASEVSGAVQPEEADLQSKKSRWENNGQFVRKFKV